MTTYTFNPTSLSQQFSNWNDPTIWAGGKVPKGPDADVVFPVITSNGREVTFYVKIGARADYSIRSLTMHSDVLMLSGTFAVDGAMDLEGDSGILIAGTLSAGSLTVNGAETEIQGHGHVNVGALVINSEIVGSNLDVNATSFTNSGQLIAISGNLTMTVDAGGFTNLVDGTLTGGTYQAGHPGSVESTTNTLYLNVGQLLTDDAADIELDAGGAIKFFDPNTSKYVAIQTTLQTIAQTGALTLSGQTYNGEASTFKALWRLPTTPFSDRPI